MSPHPSGKGRIAGSVYHHGLKTLIVLCGEALQSLFEPIAWCMSNDHRKNRRGRVSGTRRQNLRASLGPHSRAITRQTLFHTVSHNRPRLPPPRLPWATAGLLVRLGQPDSLPLNGSCSQAFLPFSSAVWESVLLKLLRLMLLPLSQTRANEVLGGFGTEIEKAGGPVF